MFQCSVILSASIGAPENGRYVRLFRVFGFVCLLLTHKNAMHSKQTEKEARNYITNKFGITRWHSYYFEFSLLAFGHSISKMLLHSMCIICGYFTSFWDLCFFFSAFLFPDQTFSQDERKNRRTWYITSTFCQRTIACEIQIISRCSAGFSSASPIRLVSIAHVFFFVFFFFFVGWFHSSDDSKYRANGTLSRHVIRVLYMRCTNWKRDRGREEKGRDGAHAMLNLGQTNIKTSFV